MLFAMNCEGKSTFKRKWNNLDRIISLTIEITLRALRSQCLGLVIFLSVWIFSGCFWSR